MSERIDGLISTFIEVSLPSPDKFLLIKETLGRIGIASNKDKKLFQSCHILHKQGKYYIVHFKELFSLDGKVSSLDAADVARRNTIAKLLMDWGLCVILGATQNFDGKTPETWPDTMKEFCPLNKIKIVAYKDKNMWELSTKYQIGKK